MATIEDRVAALERQMHGILHGHRHNTRDVLHQRVNKLELIFNLMLPRWERENPHLHFPPRES